METDDIDLIDRALDAAEDKIEDTEDVVQKTFRGEIVEEFTEELSQNAPTSTKQDLSAQEVNVESNEAVLNESPIQAPAFWAAEDKAIFAKASREVQQTLARYEGQRNEWANRISGESERGKAIEKRASEIFEPRRAELLKNRIKDPFDAVEYLLGWNDVFEKDPMTGIAELMKKNGITPYDFLNDNGGQVAQNGYYEDPRVEEALQEAREAKESFQEWQEQQANTSIMTQVEQFKNTVDPSTGQTRKYLAEMYAPQISEAVEAIQKMSPQMPLQEALAHAYGFVASESRKLFGINGGKTQSAARDPRVIAEQVRKAKSASGSVRGMSSSEATVPKSKANGRSFDEMLNNAVDGAFDTLDAR